MFSTSKWKSTTTRRLACAAAALVVGTTGLAAAGGVAQAVPQGSSGSATGTVTVNDLNVRRAPTTHSAAIVQVDRGFTFDVRCQVSGPAVGGNTTWLAVGPDVGKWVSGNYVTTRGTIPACGAGSSVRATVTADPVLNSFVGPSIKNSSDNEYQPGAKVRVRCSVSNWQSSGSTTWYLGTAGDWLPGDYVQLPRSADLPIC